MKKFFAKIGAFFHKHPGIKTTVVGGLGAAASAAASGVFGPKAAAVAAGVGAVAGLWTKRPKDATPSDKAGIVVGDKVTITGSDAVYTVRYVGERSAGLVDAEGNVSGAAYSDLTEVQA